MEVWKLTIVTNAFHDIFVWYASSVVPVADRSELRRLACHSLQHSVVRTELYCVMPIIMSGLRPSWRGAHRVATLGEFLPCETALQ